MKIPQITKHLRNSKVMRNRSFFLSPGTFTLGRRRPAYFVYFDRVIHWWIQTTTICMYFLHTFQCIREFNACVRIMVGEMMLVLLLLPVAFFLHYSEARDSISLMSCSFIPFLHLNFELIISNFGIYHPFFSFSSDSSNFFYCTCVWEMLKGDWCN